MLFVVRRFGEDKLLRLTFMGIVKQIHDLYLCYHQRFRSTRRKCFAPVIVLLGYQRPLRMSNCSCEIEETYLCQQMLSIRIGFEWIDNLVALTLTILSDGLAFNVWSPLAVMRIVIRMGNLLQSRPEARENISARNRGASSWTRLWSCGSSYRIRWEWSASGHILPAAPGESINNDKPCVTKAWP